MDEEDAAEHASNLASRSDAEDEHPGISSWPVLRWILFIGVPILLINGFKNGWF
jgi:hypothetical protein